MEDPLCFLPEDRAPDPGWCSHHYWDTFGSTETLSSGLNIVEDLSIPLAIALGLLGAVQCICAKAFCSFYRFLARFSGRRRLRGVVAKTPPPAHRMPPPLATLVLVASTVLGIAEACSSRSTPKPRAPSPTARPNITFHTYACPPTYAAWYCLNGATCFTVKIGESLLYNCECADGYMGQRCEFKDLDGSYIPSRDRVMLETASIAGGATIAVILVVVVCIAFYIHFQRKQKERRTCQVDGHRRNSGGPFSSYIKETSIPMSGLSPDSRPSHSASAGPSQSYPHNVHHSL